MLRTTDVQRFWAKVEGGGKRDPDLCWEWGGACGPAGYGLVRVDGRLMPAHRRAYLLTHGAIPEGLHIDHLCCNRTCVNPKHLEAVTPSENSRRVKARSVAQGDTTMTTPIAKRRQGNARFGAPMQQLGVRVPAELIERVDALAEQQGISRQEVALNAMLHLVTPTFTPKRAVAVANALADYTPAEDGEEAERMLPLLLRMRLGDTLRFDHMAETHGLGDEDAVAILQRMRALTPVEALALLAAVKRYQWFIDLDPTLDDVMAVRFAGLA